MTLQCWMHWFWITLCTVIAVLPPAAFGVPVPLAVGESSPDISSILHQIPSVHNNAVRNTKPLPPAADPHPVAEQIQLKNAVASQNNKSVAENRAPVLDQEESKRNKVPVNDDAGASAGVFPVPAIDDSGDSEGGVPLDLAAAAVGLKPPEKVPTRPPPVNKELELRYNAVIADSLSIKSTDAPNCSECTTAATASQQAAQIVEPAQNSTELDPLLTDESKTELSLEDIENITGFTNPSLLQEQSTEEILSWSSLSVQESREHPTGKMMSQASSSGVGQEGMDPVAIAGISLGVLAIATLASAASFVLYRTRYLNNPQTLSDKCSNPDSSGYIDDSTMRENSEEMYSLDNDSFLNSLEAMTIQNYWTDSVKHTKL